MSGYDNKYNGEYKPQTVENVTSAPYQPPPKQSKIKQHFRKFWWLHLISFIIGTILVTLLLIFVGMPNIAQNGINAAKLSMKSQVATDPKPNSIHLTMVTESKSDSPFHPWLDEFKAALFLETTEPNITPFGYITIPRVKANAVSKITVDQVMEITNLDQFAEYNKRVMSGKSYRVAIRGRTGLKEGAFPKTTINFNKVIESQGLNGLKGFEVRNITISLIPEPDGTNMRGQVFIPNPSPMTIELGTVNQTVSVDGKQIGVATIPNLKLVPGDNLIEMRSAADQAAVLLAISNKYTDGILPVTIVGDKSINAAGEELTYFSKALQSNVMQTKLTLGPALKAAGIDIVKPVGGSSSSSAAPSSVPSAVPPPAGPSTV